MAFIAPKHEGVKRLRVEGNKCHASQVRVIITSLYPVGIASIDTHRTLNKEKARLSYSKWTHKATL